jgi:hypothetical protein
MIDNLGAYGMGLRRAIEAGRQGVAALLAAYSPDLNPIEAAQTWATWAGMA